MIALSMPSKKYNHRVSQSASQQLTIIFSTNKRTLDMEKLSNDSIEKQLFFIDIAEDFNLIILLH